MAGSITLSWTDAQEIRLLKILEVYPIPLTDPDDETSPPLYTTKQWFKILVARYYKAMVKQIERESGHRDVDDNVSDDEVMT